MTRRPRTVTLIPWQRFKEWIWKPKYVKCQKNRGKLFCQKTKQHPRGRIEFLKVHTDLQSMKQIFSKNVWRQRAFWKNLTIKSKLSLFLQLCLDCPVMLQFPKTRGEHLLHRGRVDSLDNCFVSYVCVGGCLWGVYASVVSSFHVNLLWSVSFSVPESRCARSCARRGVCLLPTHLGVHLCAHSCVSADVCGEMSFCTRWNHPLPIFKLLGSIIAQVPGLQWYVAIQDPAVMQMNWILCTGWGSWSSWAGLAAGSHWSPLKRVGCRGWFPGTGARMRRRRRRREGSEGELVVWAALHV